MGVKSGQPSKTSKSVPGSACPGNKRFVVHAARGPTRGRGDARLARRLSHPVRQPGQTLTSSVAPAFITRLRWRGFTNECAREGAARHDLLRRHRGSSSTCPAPTTPPPVCRLLNHHQAIQLQWPDSSSSTLDAPRSNSTMLSDRPRCPRSPSDAGAQRHSMCRPPAVRCATTRRVVIRQLPQAKAPPAPQPHNATPPAAANVASPV